jgi:type II secretory ATPase GspE/PulE/Tfp pilus assembly ATPase PilB-like protein
MKNNPFKEGSTAHHDFNILSDLKWHCTKCELKSGQAKTWQVWRQMGIQLDTDGKGHFYKTMICGKCGNKTIHRKLSTLDISENTNVRSGLPQNLAKKVKEILKYEEALFLRKMMPTLLEVDHKFPQIRWGKNEDANDVKMSEKEIREKFILLSRSNNLLKSRYCEKCYKTGERGHFPGIYFWYKGKKHWDAKIDKNDEKGCEGCFWNNPYKWRDELNNIVNK